MERVDPPVGRLPVALAPRTFDRHEAAARYAEGLVRTRAPRPSLERSPGLAPGAWGRLAAGSSISGRAGLTLGTGTVTLLLADPDAPADLIAQSETVTAYNPGDAVAAGGADLVLPMLWVGGAWVLAGGDGSAFKFAWTGSGGIPARSGLTPGAASVTLYSLATGSLAATTTTVTALNVALGAVAGNALIGLARVDGQWAVVWEECPGDAYV